MYALLTYKHQFIQFNTMQIKESFQFTNLHAFYQNPMGLQVTLPKTKCSNTNQVSRRSSALVQLNVKQIKAHPIEMDPLSSWIPLDIIGLFQNVILLPLVDFAT